MKKIISLSAFLIILILHLQCNNNFIEHIVDFQSNRAPVILSITSDQPYSEELVAGQVFVLTVEAMDPDNHELTFNYYADTGVFSNQVNSGNGNTYTSTVTYTLPDEIPAGLKSYISVQVSDPKNASAGQSLDLGQLRTGLAVSLYSVSSLYIQPDGVFNIQWIADGDGFFQVKLTDDTSSCTIDENAGFIHFTANQPSPVIEVCGNGIANCEANFESDNEQKKLCIIVRDNLLQDTILTTVLTSDGSNPEVTMNPPLEDGATYPSALSVNLSCSDNFSCSKISYALGPGSVTNPDFSGSGTVIDGNSVDVQVGQSGEGSYQLKYIAQDEALNSSILHTVNFTIDSNAPSVIINSQQYSALSINGNTTTTLEWQCNKAGDYQFKRGDSCADGVNLTSGVYLAGSYSTANSTLISTISAAELAAGPNTVKICFTALSGISSDGSFTIAGDNIPPEVSEIFPDIGSADILPDSTVSVTFTKSVVPGTVTTNSDNTCSGSLQVSSDNFITCVPMQGSPVSNTLNTVFTLTPVALNGFTTYAIRAEDSIKDDAGNSLELYTLPNAFTTINDPGIMSVTSSTADGNYGLASNISIQITFSSPVINSGTPTLSLNSGGIATYASGSGTDTLTFTYTVAAGENSTDLDYTSINALTVGTYLKNTSGVDVNLILPATGSSLSLAGSKALQVGSDVFAVTSSSANRSYHLYEEIFVQVSFVTSAYVDTQSGTPRVSLNNGGTATYQSGTNSTVLTFRYVVGGYHDIMDLDYSSPASLSLSGGSIKDGSGNDLSLVLPAQNTIYSLAGSKDIDVDLTPVFSNPVAGVVRDENNRLEWHHCAYGQSGSACESGSTTYIFIGDAISYCANSTVGGRDDWVIPDINYHRTIYCTGAGCSASVDSDFFHNMTTTLINAASYPNSIYFWASNTASTYTAIFSYVNGGSATWGGAAYTRCVRSY